MAEERDHYILRRIKEDRKEAADKKRMAEEQIASKILSEALDMQVGGTHYKDCKIQPVEYIFLFLQPSTSLLQRLSLIRHPSIQFEK